MKYLSSTLYLAACLGCCSPVMAQVVSIKSGESVDLGAVYWVQDCRSLLKNIVSLDILEGPPGITLSLREEPVKAQRQNCPESVPGAMVVATAKDVREGRGTLKYRVRYNTEKGQRQSIHTQYLYLSPAQ